MQVLQGDKSPMSVTLSLQIHSLASCHGLLRLSAKSKSNFWHTLENWSIICFMTQPLFRPRSIFLLLSSSTLLFSLLINPQHFFILADFNSLVLQICSMPLLIDIILLMFLWYVFAVIDRVSCNDHIIYNLCGSTGALKVCFPLWIHLI